jgi:phthalate 4,5-cis-dihydrodiol dehydrogenase
VLAAAADLNPQLRERFAARHSLPTFYSAEQLLASREIDAVYIGTPHQFHREHTVLAARHGKHVIVEKPMALSLADCDAMVAAASDAHVALIVGHTHGFNPFVDVMRSLIDTGGAGRPRSLTAVNYTNFIYRPRRAEELDARQGGGVVWNQLPHLIDMVRALVQRPVKSVRAVLSSLDEARGVEALCAAYLIFEDNAIATLTYSGYDRFDTDEWHHWIGESGNQKSPAHGATRKALQAMAGAEHHVRAERYGYGGDVYKNFEAHAQPHFGKLIVSCEHADLVPTSEGVDVFDARGRTSVAIPLARQRPSHAAVLDELIAAASGGRVLRDGAFGRATVEVVLALIASARQGREVVIGDGPTSLSEIYS